MLDSALRMDVDSTPLTPLDTENFVVYKSQAILQDVTNNSNLFMFPVTIPCQHLTNPHHTFKPISTLRSSFLPLIPMPSYQGHIHIHIHPHDHKDGMIHFNPPQQSTTANSPAPYAKKVAS